MIKERLDCSFSARVIYDKANRLGLERPIRIVAPKPAKMPPLSAVLRFPIGSLLDRINAVVPRHLSRDHQDDVIGEMALAVYEGRLDEADIARRVGELVSAGYRDDHSKYGPLSLDVPLYEGSSLTLGERITRGLWQ